MLTKGDRVIYTSPQNGKRMPGQLIRIYQQRPPDGPPDVTGLTRYVIQLDENPEPIDTYRLDLLEHE